MGRGGGYATPLAPRVADDRTELNETNARKLCGPFLRPMSHVLGSQPMTEFVVRPWCVHTLATLGASNVTGRQSTTDGLLSPDHPPDTAPAFVHQAGERANQRKRDDPIAATLQRVHVLQIYRSAPRLYLAGLRSLYSSPRDTFLR